MDVSPDGSISRCKSPPMPPSVTIAIVNFNAGPQLEECLRSLRPEMEGQDWAVVIVDNASTDGSAQTLGARELQVPVPTRVEIIRNATNRGFGAAVNQAARHRPAPLLWLLNPDCRVEPGAFAALVRALDAHAGCAVVAPQLLNADGTTQESARGEPDAWTGLFGRHGLLTKLFPSTGAARRNLRARELVESGVDSAPIDWAMGASLLIRGEVFERVGGFDERFFLYWEDADLCRRIRNLGYGVRYVPGARVVHAGAGSSRTVQRLAGRAFHRSAYLYYATHTVPSRWHPARPLAWIALTVRSWWRTTVTRA
jgi:N-acetylglucosaminyl-diphospho-decaprenol L-rhamnosyltransferase